MSRDHRKLRVFGLADGLVARIYQATDGFPDSERYGLCGQVRRSAVSTAANIVEGSARRTTREYVSFLNIAAASSAETRYLVEVSARLGFLNPSQAEGLCRDYAELSARLQALIRALSPKP
jgi:four helix bundle protein